jgi:hypothetical protein
MERYIVINSVFYKYLLNNRLPCLLRDHFFLFRVCMLWSGMMMMILAHCFGFVYTICTTQAESHFSVRGRERGSYSTHSSLHNKTDRWMGSEGNDKLMSQPFHPRFHSINNKNTVLSPFYLYLINN